MRACRSAAVLRQLIILIQTKRETSLQCQFLFIKFSPIQSCKKAVVHRRTALSHHHHRKPPQPSDDEQCLLPWRQHQANPTSRKSSNCKPYLCEISPRLVLESHANLLVVYLAPISITSNHFLSRVLESLSFTKSLYSLTLTSRIMKGVRHCRCLRLNCRFGQVLRECPRLPCCPIVTVG